MMTLELRYDDESVVAYVRGARCELYARGEAFYRADDGTLLAGREPSTGCRDRAAKQAIAAARMVLRTNRMQNRSLSSAGV